MHRQVLAIALNTFLESVRQPIYFVLIMAGGLLQAMNTVLSAYSMSYDKSAEVTGDNKLLLDMGLATVFVVATLMAAFVATAVLSREIQDKTVLTVISKPVGRPLFIIGKYLGTTAAVLLATLILLIFFQFAIRHQVMSTARDHIDGPVVVFSSLAVLLAIGLGIWGNFFYGWVFSSTATFAMAPLLVIAWLMTLLIGKGWIVQSIAADWKPQVMLAGACILLAMPVLTAIALAASTRLGQVMTIVVCAGFFLLGLLSNYMLGRGAFSNHPLAEIRETTVVSDDNGDFRDAGDVWRIKLDQPPRRSIGTGDILYYGPSPNGLGIINPTMDRFVGDPKKQTDLDQSASPKSVVIRDDRQAGQDLYEIVNSGSIELARPPRAGDYLFLEPTRTNYASLVAWGIAPNLQFFWLVDAVTQAHTIPPRYVALVGAYMLAQVTGLLALSVILFQKRDVG
ncbi:MAG: ABC transporter permease [Phycisphaeraceae bacterium]|nr:ABC transporter permease [Phycisphaeraceae bacterium]MCB9847305.1 ABC transporter permease [Phycisphaeraceae bacterium]